MNKKKNHFTIKNPEINNIIILVYFTFSSFEYA